ncbi:D-inositol 3-phosphate glycosyltransferase [Variibacter gotjawalensis]|uniref:D-inositol 3-phosphate glycosyltransferase n=1 Tax=Variibacter gotjawalensis TaxID=1333996 RepID=A0A0S3PX74_9BRAD|nr:glycosyltransferase family 4 protein [Variibacter gotjawalensis]NIK46359.1 glycosyltransferase involved in cell wall biosynthesis [Variibacter gotjawalensis]RZS48269.1 glycosyltransferase involved in cell wall biosynthesis [Variibacter gotjawalensis]BAT60529.1 D-inositol 3-phosphate glycosyltransferase [Variibacter gotjawalensis]
MNILHVMRAPVGGLFRHVIDLARGQIARGHRVGIIADAETGGQRAESIFSELKPSLALGLNRIAMSRHIGLSDWAATRTVAAIARRGKAEIIHGHGAKGGAYARLAPRVDGAIRVYTPHGGSLHYAPASPLGILYFNLERVLMRRTELYLFESAFGRDRFTDAIGRPNALTKVVVNGVGPEEFEPVTTKPDAADIVFVGELRALKGVDVLIEAIARLHAANSPVRAVLVGGGPDADAFRALAEQHGLSTAVTFPGPMPARTAFALGRILAVPSRAESLPYVVLEALAAGMPTIATKVGGIPEIYGTAHDRLIPPGDVDALADAIRSGLGDPEMIQQISTALQAHVKSMFSIDRMVDDVLAAYAEARTTSGRV